MQEKSACFYSLILDKNVVRPHKIKVFGQSVGGDSNAVELIGALLATRNSGSSSGSDSSAASDLISALVSGKAGEISGKDSEGVGALLEMLGKLKK